MATDLADEIFGKKAGRIISEWLRMSDQAAAVRWISIFLAAADADQKPNL